MSVLYFAEPDYADPDYDTGWQESWGDEDYERSPEHNIPWWAFYVDTFQEEM